MKCSELGQKVKIEATHQKENEIRRRVRKSEKLRQEKKAFATKDAKKVKKTQDDYKCTKSDIKDLQKKRLSYLV